MTNHPSDHDSVLDDDRDLAALGDLRGDVPPIEPAVLAAARTRLLDQDVPPAVLSMRPRRPAHVGRRRALTGIAAAAAIAGVATGAYALTDDHPSAPQADRTTISTSTEAPTGRSATSPAEPSPVRFVNAAQLLDAASAGAASTSRRLLEGQYQRVTNHSYQVTSLNDPPGDGAYQFSENRSDTWTPRSGLAYEREDSYISVDYPDAEQRRYAASAPGGTPKRQVTWYEIDGSRYTQVYPGYESEPTVQPCDNCPDTIWDEADTADPSRFPKDAAALRRSLYAWAKDSYAELVKYGKGDQFTVDDLAYDALTRVVTRAEVPSDLRAELYQVIKTVPGITLTSSLPNYDGTTGVAVGRVDTFHVRHDLIFTGNGRTYIGDRTVAQKPSREYRVRAGTLLGATAVTVTITGKPDVPRR